MIKVVYKKNKFIDEVKISGHAMYSDYGEDIVCSAVSSIVITTINNILTIDKNAIKYVENDNGILITNLDSKIASDLLQNMLNMLSELEEQYPKNIKIGG